jgi:hypothetical protein
MEARAGRLLKKRIMVGKEAGGFGLRPILQLRSVEIFWQTEVMVVPRVEEDLGAAFSLELKECNYLSL